MVNRKNVIIKSCQYFEKHNDIIEEMKECLIEKFENGIQIVYDNCKIIVDNEIVYLENENVKLIIEKDKKKKAMYHTPYGDIEVQVEGKNLEITDGTNILTIGYLITFGNDTAYLNELQIICHEK